jgi:hypothetical protein
LRGRLEAASFSFSVLAAKGGSPETGEAHPGEKPVFVMAVIELRDEITATGAAKTNPKREYAYGVDSVGFD